MKRMLLIFALVLCFPLTANAARYYVINATGSDDSTGTSEAGAWASLAKAADTVAAGDSVFVKSGTSYTAQDGANGCVLYCTTAGTATQPITYIGYTTTINDGGIATIDANTNSLARCVYGNLAAWYHCFKNFRFTGASSSGVSLNGTAGDRTEFFNCQFDTNGAFGLQGDDTISIIKCTFNNNTSGGSDTDNYTIVLSCQYYTNSGIACTTEAVPTIIYSLFYNNGGNACVKITSDYMSLISNCTFDGDNAASSIGVLQNDPDGNGPVVTNCIFYDLETGISRGGTVGENNYCDYNFYYSNTADLANIDYGPNDVIGTGDPFTNSDGRDYTLASEEAKNAGLDRGSYMDVGAYQAQATGSSGGLLAANKRGNKQ